MPKCRRQFFNVVARESDRQAVGCQIVEKAFGQPAQAPHLTGKGLPRLRLPIERTARKWGWAGRCHVSERRIWRAFRIDADVG